MDTLQLKRDQLKSIAGGDDHDVIRQLENLFALVNEVPSLQDDNDSNTLGIATLSDLVRPITIEPVQPITGQIGVNTTYTISSVATIKTIWIPAAYLVASAGGPFTLTITTGAGTTVKVPIAAFGDTISSGDLLFDVQIDASGNVISKSWEISGSNTNGIWVVKSDGNMDSWFTDPTLRTTNNATGTLFKTADVTLTFPIAFLSTTGLTVSSVWVTDSGSFQAGWSASGQNGLTVSSCSVCGFANANNRIGYVGFIAAGRWR